jgi:hypothetical protein
MKLNVRSEVTYNSHTDQVNLAVTSDDFPEPVTITVPRNTDQDRKLREVIEEQELFSFADLAQSVKLPRGSAGVFGVYSDGEEAPFSVQTTQHLIVRAKDGSGVINFARNYVLFAVQNNCTVIAVNADQTLDSTLAYVPAHKLITAPTVRSVMDSERFEEALEDGEKFLVLNFEAPTFAGDILRDPTEDLQEFFLACEDFPEDLYSLTVVKDTETYMNDDYGVPVAFMGNVHADVAEKVVGDRTVTRNPRGVLWLKHSYNAPSERINTYVVPRDAWGSVSFATGINVSFRRDAARTVVIPRAKGFVSAHSFLS